MSTAAAVQVAFDQSAISATPIRTYVVPKGGRSGPSSGIRLKCPEPNDEDAVIAYDADGILPDKMGKHYREPWVWYTMMLYLVLVQIKYYLYSGL